MCWGVQHARQAPIQIPLVRNRVRRALMAFILVRRQEKSLTTRRTALHVLPTPSLTQDRLTYQTVLASGVGLQRIVSRVIVESTKISRGKTSAWHAHRIQILSIMGVSLSLSACAMQDTNETLHSLGWIRAGVSSTLTCRALLVAWASSRV